MSKGDGLVLGLLAAGVLYAVSQSGKEKERGDSVLTRSDDQLAANPRSISPPNRRYINPPDGDVYSDEFTGEGFTEDFSVSEKEFSDLDPGALLLRSYDEQGRLVTYKVQPDDLSSFEQRKVAGNDFTIVNDTLLTNPISRAKNFLGTGIDRLKQILADKRKKEAEKKAARNQKRIATIQPILDIGTVVIGQKSGEFIPTNWTVKSDIVQNMLDKIAVQEKKKADYLADGRPHRIEDAQNIQRVIDKMRAKLPKLRERRAREARG